MADPYKNRWIVTSYSEQYEDQVFQDLVIAADVRSAEDFVKGARGHYAIVCDAQPFENYLNWVGVLQNMSDDAARDDMKLLEQEGQRERAELEIDEDE